MEPIQKKALVCSHAGDVDGFASAAISRKFLELCGFSVSYLGVDWGDGQIPDNRQLMELAAEVDLVVITDFSLDHDFCNEQFKQRKLVWIDHHISAIQDSEAHPYREAPGIRRVGVAAQVLAWEYWTGRLNVGDPLPIAIELFGKYDVFDKDERWDLMVLPFQQWGRSLEHLLNPANDGSQEIWEMIFAMSDQEIEEACSVGSQILAAQKNQLIKGVADVHRAKLAGYNLTFAAMNGSGHGSAVFDGADVGGCDAMLTYHFNGREWKISMYGWDNSPDLSEIAKSFGGGGHKGAAGFRLPYIHPTLQLMPLIKKEEDPEQSPDADCWPFFINAEDLQKPVEQPGLTIDEPMQDENGTLIPATVTEDWNRQNPMDQH